MAIEIYRNPFVALKRIAATSTSAPTKPSSAQDMSGTTNSESAWRNCSDLLDMSTPIRVEENVGVASVPVAGQVIRQNVATLASTTISLSFLLDDDGSTALNYYANSGTNYKVEFAFTASQPSSTNAVAVSGLHWGWGVMTGAIGRFQASAESPAVSGAFSISANTYEVL